MARPSQAKEQRARVLPILVEAFVELGYRRSTTAELARRCGVQENILYRLFPDKKSMFLAAIDHVAEVSRQAWDRVRARGGEGSVAQRLLEYEARHQGEFGNFRIVFTGLSETDDPDIRKSLRQMYLGFQAVIQAEIEIHREASGGDAALSAWAVIGLATTVNIGRQLRCLSKAERSDLLGEIGGRLIDG